MDQTCRAAIVTITQSKVNKEQQPGLLPNTKQSKNKERRRRRSLFRVSLDPTNNHLPLSRDKSRKKPGSDCDCDPGRGSTAEAAGLNRTGWSSHINGDEGLNMRYRRRVTPRPEPISRLVSLAAGERQEATASRAAARAPGGLCPGGNDTTCNPSPLAVKKNKKT